MFNSKKEIAAAFFMTYRSCAAQENLASGEGSPSRHGEAEFRAVENPSIFDNAQELADRLRKKLSVYARKLKFVDVSEMTDEEAIEATWFYMIENAESIAELISV